MAGDWSMAFGMVLTGFLVALSALLLLAAWQSRQSQPRPSIFEQGSSLVAFLFDGERLLDASPAARALLPEGEDNRARSRLITRFAPDFPNLSERLASLPRIGQLQIPSRPGTPAALVLRAEHLSEGWSG